MSDDDGHHRVIVAAAATAASNFALQQQRQRRARTNREWAAVLSVMLLAEECHLIEQGSSVRLTRRVVMRPDYSQSAWAVMLRTGQAALNDHTSRKAATFRRRFRIPYKVFVQLVGMVRELGWFPSREYDIAGRQCIPLELKLSSSGTICRALAQVLCCGDN